MSTPTLDGSPIWGFKVRVVPVQEERASTTKPWFAHDGVGGKLDGGSRGTTITITGEHRSPTGNGLADAQTAVRTANDGASHKLVDNFGHPWPQCLVGPLEPLGKVRRKEGGLYFAQSYRCALLCLRY